MDGTIKDLKQQFEGAWRKVTDELYDGPESLLQAVRYSCDGPGKKVRPLSLLLAGRSLGAHLESCMSAAIAVEMIHCYSLVHDDLPSMDDDDFRRGRPTTHKVYSEATAILAGDALLTDSFLVIARDPILTDPIKTALTLELAKAAGSKGMVLGQGLDMDATRYLGLKTSEGLDRIHVLKTGALLSASFVMAALCAGRADLTEPMRTAGISIGLAFQIMDDLLDESKGTGKSAGKDKAQNKLTYLSFYSREQALHLAKHWTSEGKAILKDLGMVSELLGYLDLLLNRES
jgi:geranylgeranyl pyrophosphate synthase